ncbi:pirin family protein [uncultured Hydrogenophaga sp.]|uniref:pirin family protein n=1 Tax=uncultured Hydrogenophaga sp. TaxID=199683 RepID=UPI00265DAC25|nr:pirin family protein [uncultured Hydrogenophaga sp.]
MFEMLIQAREADLGHGLKVRRVLPYAKRRMVGPFIFWDHAGPVTMPADQTRQADVRPHPHIGLATVSYLLGGSMTHRDSLGTHQLIRPGDVNWMTAGSGISHSERFTHPDSFEGGGLELMQSWVALPAELEEVAPSFAHTPQADLPTWDEAGVWMRLVAGEAFGQRSPVVTLSPLFHLHAECRPGARLRLPGQHAEQAVYVARGSLSFQGQPVLPGQLLVFGRDTDVDLTAPEAATVFLFGGEPLGPRHIFWNFVSSRPERIEQAKADWKAGRFALPPGDDREWIPLP